MGLIPFPLSMTAPIHNSQCFAQRLSCAWFVVFIGLGLGCGRGSAAQNAAASEPEHPKIDPAPARAPLTGDRLAYRFVDHAGEAKLDIPPPGLAAAWNAFHYPYKLPSPYS